MSHDLGVLKHRFPHEKDSRRNLLSVLYGIGYPDYDILRFCNECIDAEGLFWKEFKKQYAEGIDTATQFVLNAGSLANIPRPASMASYKAYQEPYRLRENLFMLFRRIRNAIL
jgi:hypothetical protein